MSASSPPSNFSTSAKTQYAMIAADPQIARLADRINRRLRRIVGIALQVGLNDKQPVEFVLIKPGSVRSKPTVRRSPSSSCGNSSFQRLESVKIVCDCVGSALRRGPTSGNDGARARACTVSIDFDRAHVAQAERAPVSLLTLSIHERDEANEWT
jgi:hypothetical protein